jgi:hypothetical protein
MANMKNGLTVHDDVASMNVLEIAETATESFQDRRRMLAARSAGDLERADACAA